MTCVVALCARSYELYYDTHYDTMEHHFTFKNSKHIQSQWRSCQKIHSQFRGVLTCFSKHCLSVSIISEAIHFLQNIPNYPVNDIDDREETGGWVGATIEKVRNNDGFTMGINPSTLALDVTVPKQQFRNNIRNNS